MGDVKKWSVTYTKHVKQKRKVYQDGTLHLLNNKVALYDECEQLLDSKFLTRDEVVRSGESLTFASFLVDIGDPDSNCTTFSNLNPISEHDNKPDKKMPVREDEKLRHTFTNRKLNTAGRKPSFNCLSPSQKIIKEFKKNQEIKYGAHHSPTSPATSSFKEWEVLYTTQITQKAKKYHDGFIRMIICGSERRQVILFDSGKNQIDKRFLKKDEVVSSGESLTFDAYLVDIGDPTGDNEDDADVKRRNHNATEKSDTLAGRQWKKLFSDNSVSHAKRSKGSTQKDDLGSGNSIVIGQSRGNAISSKRVYNSVRSSGLDQIKQKQNITSDMPLRDANQILSILKKSAARDTNKVVKDSPVEQCLSKHNIEGSLQVDCCQEIRAAGKHTITSTMTADRVQASTCYEGNVMQSGPIDIDSSAPYLYAKNIDTAEIPVSTQTAETIKPNALESPSKSQNTVGYSVGLEKSVILDSSKGADFKDSHSSVRREDITHHQFSTKLPETIAETDGKTASSLKMGDPKLIPVLQEWFGDDVGIKKSKMSVKSQKSDISFICPSFDLGI
ncbi:unnamed protein product [Amaranthus hypochondriacus]